MALWRCIACLAVPLYCCIAPSLCRSVVVSLYRCVAESLSRCFAVSSYRCVAHTFSGPGGDSGTSQELSWTLSCTTVLRRRRSLVLIETAEDSASRPQKCSQDALTSYLQKLPKRCPPAARHRVPRAASRFLLRANALFRIAGIHSCLTVSQCSCGAVSLHHCVAVSLCSCIAVSLCR